MINRYFLWSYYNNLKFKTKLWNKQKIIGVQITLSDFKRSTKKKTLICDTSIFFNVHIEPIKNHKQKFVIDNYHVMTIIPVTICYYL